MTAKATDNRIPWVRLLVFLFCGLLVYRIISGLGWHKILELVLQADLGLLIAGIVTLFGYYLIWVWKWHFIVARLKRLPFGVLWRLQLAGSFINLVTPTARLGGGFLRAMALEKQYGFTLPAGYGLVLADQLTGFVGKVLLIGFLCLAALGRFPKHDFEWLLLPIGILSLIVAFSWPWARVPLGRKLASVKAFWIWRIPFLQKIIKNGEGKKWIEQLLEPSFFEGKKAEVLVLDLGLSALSFALFCLSNSLVLKAMGCDVSLAAISIVMVVGYLIGSVTGIMGGAGTTELALIGLYATIGIDEGQAAAGALVHRGLFYLVVLIIGGFSTWRIRL